MWRPHVRHCGVRYAQPLVTPKPVLFPVLPACARTTARTAALWLRLWSAWQLPHSWNECCAAADCLARRGRPRTCWTQLPRGFTTLRTCLGARGGSSEVCWCSYPLGLASGHCGALRVCAYASRVTLLLLCSPQVARQSCRSPLPTSRRAHAWCSWWRWHASPVHRCRGGVWGVHRRALASTTPGACTARRRRATRRRASARR